MVSYGSGAAGERRRWLHARLVEMTAADELPTTVSSLYYDGVGASPAPWLSDEADLKRKVAAARRARTKVPTKPRTPRQDVSYDVQWLIEHGLVAAAAVVDLSRNLIDHWAPTDLDEAVRRYAETVTLSPWGDDEPQPLVVVESRSLAGALEGVVQRYAGLLVPLGGMPGRSFLRELGDSLVWPPIAYLGDYNKPGGDIAAHVRAWLEEHGWGDRWTLLAVTDDDAEELPSKLKVDGRSGRSAPSIEAEALGTTELRRRLTEWFDELLSPGFSWEAHEERTRAQREAVLVLLDGSPS